MRIGTYSRSTKETTISAALNLDGGAGGNLDRHWVFRTTCWSLGRARGIWADPESRRRPEGGRTPHRRGHRHRAGQGFGGGTRGQGRYPAVWYLFRPYGRVARHGLAGCRRPPVFGFRRPFSGGADWGLRFLPDRRVFPGAGVSCRASPCISRCCMGRIPTISPKRSSRRPPCAKEAVTPAEGILSIQRRPGLTGHKPVKGENP